MIWHAQQNNKQDDITESTVRKIAEKEFDERCHEEMVEYLEKTKALVNKATSDDDDDTCETKQKKKSQVLEFWQSVSVTAPDAKDHKKEGSFWGKDLR